MPSEYAKKKAAKKKEAAKVKAGKKPTAAAAEAESKGEPEKAANGAAANGAAANGDANGREETYEGEKEEMLLLFLCGHVGGKIGCQVAESEMLGCRTNLLSTRF